MLAMQKHPCFKIQLPPRGLFDNSDIVRIYYNVNYVTN